MAEIYLTPEDISPSDTRIVLVFLNTVHSAEEIARRIEIPDELDIGVRLGQRILDAREQLNGQFSNLQELMNVPLIGPERFTEVVTEALQKSALDILAAQTSGENGQQVIALAAQLEALKQWASDFETLNNNRYKIDIQALDQTPYLGEVMPIRIRVWDRIRRTPKANLPLTIETNWGTLRWNKGLQVKQGTVITARTSVGGEVNCLLYTPTIEPLTEPQQNELSLALGKLTHGSDVPSQARESFQELAAQYRHPLNVDLRKGIDIHYKSRQDRVAESVNLPTSIYSWVYEQALIRAYAHPQDENEKSTVLAMSALPIEYRDWLSPWYQMYKEGLLDEQELQSGLANAIAYSENEQGMVGHLVSNIHSFIAKQNGLIGERIGQQASQEVLARLLANNQENLSPNTQASLYTILGQAPSAITSSGKGSVGIANEVALDVGRNNGVFDAIGDLGNINFDQLTSDLAAFNGNYSTFTDNFSTFSNNYSTFENNYATFETDYSSFSENYTSFNTDYSNFNNNYSDFNNDYADFNNNYGNWQLDLGNFNNDYGDFQTGLSDFNTAADQLIVNVTNGVNAALSTVERNVSGTTGTTVVINPVESVVVGRNITRPPGRG